MKKIKGISPSTYLFIYLTIMVVLNFLFPFKRLINPPLNLLGILFIFLGLGINLWADNLFNLNQTTAKPNGKPSALITGGPFAFTRHPMYLGFVCFLLGIAILLGSLSPFLGPIAMVVTCDRLFIPQEENNLTKIFGKKYLAYKKKVGRWL